MPPTSRPAPAPIRQSRAEKARDQACLRAAATRKARLCPTELLRFPGVPETRLEAARRHAVRVVEPDRRAVRIRRGVDRAEDAADQQAGAGANSQVPAPVLADVVGREDGGTDE